MNLHGVRRARNVWSPVRLCGVHSVCSVNGSWESRVLLHRRQGAVVIVFVIIVLLKLVVAGKDS